MKKFAIICIMMMLIPSIIGCAVLDDSGSKQPDYEDTKQMVVDMLQTEEGKKAIQDVLKEEEMKEQLLMEQDFIKETIQQTLASEDGKEYWQKVMQNPEFAKTFAESMQEENEKLLKGLMKDPDYQGMMLDIMKDPEMEKNSVELMKTKEYRKEITNVVTEAMESPLFVARVYELLQNIAKEELKSSEDDQASQSGGNTEEEPPDDEESESMGSMG